MPPDESRILRDRLASAIDAFDTASAGGDPFGAAAVLIQTTTDGSYPTVAAAMYACNPVAINGPETEGAGASYVADTSTTLYALNTGSAVPPQGTVALAQAAGGRLVLRFDG